MAQMENTSNVGSFPEAGNSPPRPTQQTKIDAQRRQERAENARPDLPKDSQPKQPQPLEGTPETMESTQAGNVAQAPNQQGEVCGVKGGCM